MLIPLFLAVCAAAFLLVGVPMEIYGERSFPTFSLGRFAIFAILLLLWFRYVG